MPKPLKMTDIDTRAFVQALDQCTGSVWLVTAEGDRFNLKSKLSQLAGIINLIEGGRLVEATVECDKLEDEALLFRLNLFGG